MPRLRIVFGANERFILTCLTCTISGSRIKYSKNDLLKLKDSPLANKQLKHIPEIPGITLGDAAPKATSLADESQSQSHSGAAAAAGGANPAEPKALVKQQEKGRTEKDLDFSPSPSPSMSPKLRSHSPSKEEVFVMD